MDSSNNELKFVVDVMLGRLANYLLLLGFDCEYRRQFPDDDLLKFAETENRVIITRDADLAAEYSTGKVCHLKTTELAEQLKKVKEKFSLNFSKDRLFTRCVGCNKPLVEIEKKEVEEEIPSRTRSWLDTYYRCPGCEKVYWRGTHYEAVVERLENWDLLDG